MCLGSREPGWAGTGLIEPHNGAFSKPGRSAAAEGNSNTWWMNVLSGVSKTGDFNK